MAEWQNGSLTKQATGKRDQHQTYTKKEKEMYVQLNNTIEARFNELGMTEAQKMSVGLHVMTIFSAALGHRPYVETEDRTYGNLCMVLVGDTGKGKGSSCRFAKEIFSGFGEDTVSPMTESTNITSMKALLGEIDGVLSTPSRSNRGEVRILHINEEFGGLLRAAGSSYHAHLDNGLCKLIDGVAITEAIGRKTIEYPLIHYALVGHITPQSLRLSMREHLINCGWANRLLWIGLPEGMTTPLPRMSQEKKTALEDEIREKLNFAKNVRAVQLSQEAEERYASFHAKLEESPDDSNGLMKSMTARFPLHTLKIALVLALLRGKSQIEGQEMTDAIELVNMSTQTIEECFIPQSKKTSHAPVSVEKAIVDKLEKGAASPSALYSELVGEYKIAHIRRALKELEVANMVALRPVDTGDGYFPKCYSLTR